MSSLIFYYILQYGGILTVVFILEMSCSISIYTYRTTLMEGFDEGISQAMNSYYNETQIAKDFDNMQQKVKGL